MPQPTSRLTRSAAILLLLAASSPGVTSSLADARGALALRMQQQAPPAKCCFSNPAYAGTCEVEPAKDETCASILQYLNNPMSQGKGYCGNTTTRGGWKSTSCAPQ